MIVARSEDKTMSASTVTKDDIVGGLNFLENLVLTDESRWTKGAFKDRNGKGDDCFCLAGGAKETGKQLVGKEEAPLVQAMTRELALTITKGASDQESRIFSFNDVSTRKFSEIRDVIVETRRRVMGS